MITYDDGINRFSFRVAGVMIQNNKILLHVDQALNLWTIPGGRVEFKESTEEAIIRELKEELNEAVTVNRLLWVAEDFFKLEHKEYHQLCFYYLINLKSDSTILTQNDKFKSHEIDNNLIYKWVEFSELRNLELKPTFIIDKLDTLTDHIEHIISSH